MKDKEQIENISDAELVKLFNQANSTQEKLQYFSRIQDYNCQMELLNSISDNEKYKFIGKIKSSNCFKLFFGVGNSSGIVPPFFAITSLIFLPIL